MNNIEKIKNYFLNKEQKALLINELNENVSAFYEHVIKHFSKKSNFILDKSIEVDRQNNNLFELSSVGLFLNSKSDTIKKILSSNSSAIIFTDYKNFKKYSNETININAYEYAMDIKCFVHQELNYQNQSLIEFCINEPGLFFSEISKFEIMNKFYESLGLKQETNQIVEIRKNIFNLKKNSNNIKDLYENLIAEVRYKKFNFLTY